MNIHTLLRLCTCVHFCLTVQNTKYNAYKLRYNYKTTRATVLLSIFVYFKIVLFSFVFYIPKDKRLNQKLNYAQKVKKKKTKPRIKMALLKSCYLHTQKNHLYLDIFLWSQNKFETHLIICTVCVCVMHRIIFQWLRGNDFPMRFFFKRK